MQTQARNQVSILPILWQSCLACHVAVVYSLAKLSTACHVLRRLCFQLQDDAESLKVGVAECFEQAKVCLAHYITYHSLHATWTPSRHRPLERGGGPGCRFPPFCFVCFHMFSCCFMFRVFGCLWAQVPKTRIFFLPVVDQAEKEPSW